MKRIVMSLLGLLMAVWASANDGVYYVSGNHLVPVQETDIAVTKEVLTISICDDGYATVDVYYELTNRGKEKTIDMGFEAALPYNSGDAYDPKGRHPYIEKFRATVNGEQLKYKTGVVKASSAEVPSNLRPLDVKQYHTVDADAWEMGNTALVDSKGEEVNIAYAYYFRATFKKGLNKVHHQYRYKMSYGVYRSFEIPYWLTPATRWANHQIDDFTLRIKAVNTAKHFYTLPRVFKGASFRVTEGTGKVRKRNSESVGEVIEVTLRNGTVEWHAKNFKPKENMFINSADIILDGDIGAFYDRGRYMPQPTIDFKKFYGRQAKNEAEEKELIGRVMRNLPYADRGYVFKDQKLQHYFESQWWYMPDADWQMSTDDFTKQDFDVVNELWKMYDE